MKKLIISTIIKTAAVVLGLIMIAAASLVMFAPVKLADFNKRIGNYSLAASFNIIDYNRTKDIDRLAEIVNLSIAARSDKKILKYSDLLIKHTKFDEYCRRIDGEASSGIYASYKQYIYGWNVTALYNRGKKEQAFETAKAAVTANYSINNCFSYLIRAVADSGDEAVAAQCNIFLIQLLDGLDSSKEGYVQTMGRIILDMDRLNAAGLLSAV